MLVKASSVISLPVITFHDGKKIEVIKDLLYNPKGNRIAAFLVDTGGFFSEARVIVFEDIVSIGDDAVLIASQDVLQKASNVKHDIQSIAKSETYLTGVSVLTETGVSLGTVSDLYFNVKSGIVEEFEVTHGDLRNPHAERRRVKISDIITLGKDVTIVKVPNDNYHEYAARKSESRGIMRAIQNMRHAVKEHLDNMSHTTKNDEQVAVTKQQGATQAANDKVSDQEHSEITVKDKKEEVRPSDTRMQGVVGLYVTKNILTLDDTILAKEGDIVTHKLLAEAEAAGVLDEVLNNVTHHIQLGA